MTTKENFVGIDKDKYVPILKDESISFLFEQCKKYQPKTILEIGTYIGYSSSVMLSCSPNAKVDTIEKIPENAELAKVNLSIFGDRANVINADAFDVIKKFCDENKKYDFIFLDGPKGQYIKYLPYLKKILNVGGVLIADNIFFHGLVEKEGAVAHKHRTIVYNLREFIDTITHDQELKSEIYHIGDGLSLSIKVK